MTKPLFTKKGNTAGFDARGRAVMGWFGKDKLWHVGQVGSQTAEYLTNGTHKLFDTNAAASLYAQTLIDQQKTAELAWWN